MGIRIEDSIAVGEENPFVLTTEAVKEVGVFFTTIFPIFFVVQKTMDVVEEVESEKLVLIVISID